jgi:hypothetical protein
MHRIPCEKLTVLSKHYHCECGHFPGGSSVQFSDKRQDFPKAWNRLRALKLCATYSQSCMEFLKILGTTALMASSFRHTGQIQSLQRHFSFWYCPNFVCHFLFKFLRLEILVLTATKHLSAYLYLNVRIKFSFMNMLLQLLYSLRQGFLTFFYAMDSFYSLVKPTDLFQQKCI